MGFFFYLIVENMAIYSCFPWKINNSVFIKFQIENAAEEPRVLCIIQDTTNSKTVNERITLNLPASTPLRKLFEDVANKVGYINGTFDLVWGNGINTADMVKPWT